MRKVLSFFVVLLVSLVATTAMAQDELTRYPVFTMGENNSQYYRIPAIAQTADGTLVALADQRGSALGDLPNVISIVAKTSTDGGKNWSDMVTVAQGGESGSNSWNKKYTSYGDAAVVYDAVANKLVAVFVGYQNRSSYNKVGLWDSASSKLLDIFQSESTDNGATWTTPVSISNTVYGGVYTSDKLGTKKYGLFAGSGSAVQLKKGEKAGRLMFVVAARQNSTSGGDMSNFAVYSDDHGATWTVSDNAACASGDEAKIVELENGDLLMSIKNRKDDSSNGSGYRLMAKSTDQGKTWTTADVNSKLMDPGCNGDVVSIEYDGKYYLLHSLPGSTSTRENVTVYASLDGGQTWPIKRKIYNGYSAYSTLQVLSDGTIGIIVEEGKWDSALEGEDGFNLAYYNFTMDWLMAETNFDAIELIESATALLSKNGIGYPSTIAKAALKSAIEAVEANPTTETMAALTTAMETYYTTSEIERPQAGKVYSFISKGKTADYYMYNNDGTLALASYTEGAELPDAAKFTCEIDAETGKYMFKTFDETYYLAYPTIGGKSWLDYESETGLESSVSNVTKFTIDKVTINGNVVGTAQDLFGYVHLWGYRGYDNGKFVDMEGPIIVKSSAGSFDGAGDDYYNANFSSAFQIIPQSKGTPVVLDRSTWEVFTVSSQYAGLDGDNYVTGEMAIDDDPATYWHSDWDNASNKTVPQWIVFNLGEVIDITAFSYSARTAEARGANGAIKEYKLYISETAPSLDDLTGTMTEIKSGEFTYPNATHNVDLGGEFSAQYVMLYATSTYGGTAAQDNQFANCAEFTLTGIPSGPAPTTYTVTVSSNIAGAGTVTVNGAEGSAEIVENAKATLAATVNTGYEFVNWTYTNGQVVSTEQTFKATITGAVEYVANYNKLQVETNYCTVSGNNTATRYLKSVTVSTEESGSIEVPATTAKGVVYVNRSASHIIEAAPGGIVTFPEYGWQGEWMHSYAFIDYNGDYEFSQVANNDGTTGGELVTYNCYNEKDINGKSASPQYANTNTYTNAYGTSKGLPAFKLPEDLQAGDYRFRISVVWNTTDPCGYDDIKPHGGCLLDITLRIVGSRYVVTVAPSDEEMGSAYIGEAGTTTTKVASDGTQTVELTAVANDAYEFVNWTLNGEEVSTEAVYTTAAITGDCNYIANFKVKSIEPRTVKVKSSNNQKGYAVFVSPQPEGTATDVTTGEWVTVKAMTQTEDDFFVNWTINDVEVGTETEYTYKGAEAATIQANFISKYVMTMAVAGNGSATLSSENGGVASGTRVLEGTVVTLSVTPDYSYEVSSVIINGVEQLTEAQASFSTTINVASTVDVSVTFSEITATLTYAATGMGSIEVWSSSDEETFEPAGDKYENGASVPFNSDIYIYAYAQEGASIESFTINGETGDDFLGDFIAQIEEYGSVLYTVTGNVDVQVKFTAPSYTVQVAVSPTADYGTIAINGVESNTATVTEGTEVTAVATPAAGKVFEGWYTYMGEELSTEATYTFTVTADLAIQAWFADEAPAVVEYCTYSGNSQHAERRLNALTITDGVNETTVSSIQPSFKSAIYVDKTDVAFPTYAGASVNFSSFDWKGEWMHAFVYVDYNNDGTFDTTVNADGTTGGELVSFTFYSATDSGTGVNSLGETVSNYTIPMVNYLPAFTLPADLENGEYRVRVKIDWSHLDPCGHPTESANKLTTNGGCIADFTMSVDDENGVEFAEVDGAQVYAADGVIYINGYEGEVKVVNIAGQVVKDVTVDGNDTLEVAAGLYIVVTGDQVTKVVVK